MEIKNEYELRAKPGYWLMAVGLGVVMLLLLCVGCEMFMSMQPAPVIKAQEMIRIPAGEFIMGSDTGDEDEKPVHKIYLNEYFIDKYEITNAQYAECMAAGKCTPPHENSFYNCSWGVDIWCGHYGDAQYANYPVIKIDWTQAKNYCEFVGKRLPTEAEWEKAARGTDGRTYPWGNEAQSCDRLNYNRNCQGDTAEVGSYSNGASPYGVMDMAGNVWEWTSSEYKPYPYKVDDDHDEILDDNRVLRGGGWDNIGYNTRTTRRNKYNMMGWAYDVGSRCVR